MLHRYTISLFDEDHDDVNILDKLEGLKGHARQRMLRMLLIAGCQKIYGRQPKRKWVRDKAIASPAEKPKKAGKTAKEGSGKAANNPSSQDDINPKGLSDKSKTEGKKSLEEGADPAKKISAKDRLKMMGTSSKRGSE